MKYMIDTQGTKITAVFTTLHDGAANDSHTTIDTNLDPRTLLTEYSWVNGALLHTGTAPSPFHIYSAGTGTWIDTRSLNDLKVIQWEMIKVARNIAEYAGFTWDGSVFDSDAISQQRITGAVTLAQLSTEFVMAWTLADNSVRVLSQLEMLDVGMTLGAHVATQFIKGQALRAQIETATTKEEVGAIVW